MKIGRYTFPFDLDNELKWSAAREADPEIFDAAMPTLVEAAAQLSDCGVHAAVQVGHDPDSKALYVTFDFESQESL